MNSEIQVFAGRIYRVGLIRYVDVPPEISKTFGRSPHVPVTGTIEGIPVQTTLVSRGKGAYRMAVHGDVRKKLHADSGAVVEVAIALDEEPREPVLPPAMVLALRNAPGAQRKFREMTTALRRQVVRYLTSVKSQETLERRVCKLVDRWQREAQKPRRKAHKQKRRDK